MFMFFQRHLPPNVSILVIYITIISIYIHLINCAYFFIFVIFF